MVLFTWCNQHVEMRSFHSWQHFSPFHCGQRAAPQIRTKNYTAFQVIYRKKYVDDWVQSMNLALDTATKSYMEMMRFRYIYTSDVSCLNFVSMFNCGLGTKCNNFIINPKHVLFRLSVKYLLYLLWTPDTGYQPYISSKLC